MTAPGTGAVRIADFAAAHLDDVIVLCEQQGWTTLLEDPGRTRAALLAPGVVTIVALEEDRVVGFAQALSDGLQAYLARLLVAPSARRRGVGRQLLLEALRRSAALRIDLLAQEGSEEFYRSLPHRESTGFRIVAERP
jgi:GNAT superfamily N-acetyltransferase